MCALCAAVTTLQSEASQPGVRLQAALTTLNGRVWLFGGYGLSQSSNGYLNGQQSYSF